MFAREKLASWLAGALLCTRFFSTVRDGLARARAPGPQAAELSMCTPEDLVSPDVLTVLFRYRTNFPAVPSWYGTDLISTTAWALK